MPGDTQTFAIDRKFAALYKWTPWILIVVVLFFVALPFLADGDRPWGRFGAIGVSVFGTILCGVLAWYVFRIAKQLPYCSVSVDRDGLWLANRSKEDALIQWQDVHSTRERPYRQRLDLLDKKGDVLIKLRYELSNLDALRALLLEKISTPTQPAGPTRFAKHPIHHLGFVATMVCLAALGWFVGASNPLIEYGGVATLAALLVYHYLTTVSRVEISRDRLQLGFPFRTREILRSEIEAVRIGDPFHFGSSRPEVGLVIRGRKKPVRLSELGIDAMKLHQILDQWRQGAR